MADLLLNPGSYLGIIIFLILTGCGLPIPEEVPIIGAAVFSARGDLDPWLAFACCLVGAVLGDCVMWAIGYFFGHNLLKDHPKFSHLLHADREAKYEVMIRNHGLKVLLVARFMVGVRSPVYFAAGVLRIPFRRFLLMDLLCATVVVSLVFAIAYAYGEAIARLVRTSEIALTVVVIIAIVTVGVIFHRRRAQRMTTDANTARSPAPAAKKETSTA